MRFTAEGYERQSVRVKIENHAAAIALHFKLYNFCGVHKKFRVTPAMEAELAYHVWTIEELFGVLR